MPGTEERRELALRRKLAERGLTNFASGSVAWTGHDYKGKPGSTGWHDINSHYGVFDIAGFEKDKGSYYRSWWLATGGPFVRASPSDWTGPVPVTGS